MRFLRYLFFLLTGFAISSSNPPQEAKSKGVLVNKKADGYRGIWFTLGQFSEYGDKYSGGLGTYTVNHVPIAIYAPKVDKTFFVYGGTTQATERHLLLMAGYFDHKRNLVPKPTIVFDKQTVDDPHDNPSLSIDDKGYIWIFVSGRAKLRPGFKLRSRQPYNIDAFDEVTVEEMTYPQPWFVPGKGFFHFFTKYTKGRELYFETSPDGKTWTDDQKIAGMGGHYQVSSRYKNKFGTFFNMHPNGDVDKRTNLYYLQTEDWGKTWTTAGGQKVVLPLSEKNNPALVIDYQAQGKNMYQMDLTWDKNGYPVMLYLTSKHHQPGPQGGPREWLITKWNGNAWETYPVTSSDHNYDVGSLYINDKEWKIIGPSADGPQGYQTGGEMELWVSKNEGKTWEKQKQITKNSPSNHTYARRPLNAKEPFMAFWADGNPKTLSKSQLYFTNGHGSKVWQLPYTMTSETAKPMEMKK